MVSKIDPTRPAGPVAYTADVRGNFAAAKSEIEELQENGGGGGGAEAPYTEQDRSGVITLGGTAQIVMAANSARRGAFIQNLSAAEMYVRTDADASPAPGSEWLPPGSRWSTGANTGAISLYGASIGQAFTAKEH
jgi:hypothetical protein